MYFANHCLVIDHVYVKVYAWCEVRRAFVVNIL